MTQNRAVISLLHLSKYWDPIANLDLKHEAWMGVGVKMREIYRAPANEELGRKRAVLTDFLWIQLIR